MTPDEFMEEACRLATESVDNGRFGTEPIRPRSTVPGCS
jgi:hypothetical protein